MKLPEKEKTKLLQIESELTEHSFPPQIVIETTSYCNMKCSHCSHVELERPKAHMEESLFKKIVKEIGEKSPQSEIWPTFYGEALILGNQIWDYIDYASREGCENIVLNSNGRLLDRANHFDRILNSPLKRFILSLDGFSKATFESIRIGGNRDKIYSFVEELLYRKAKLNREYPVIIAQFSKMKENEHEVDQFKKYWQRLGAEVKVRPKLEWASVGSIHADNLDHNPDFRIACPWGNNTMAIHQNGDIVACAVDWAGKFIAGNARDNTLEEIWKILSERLRKYHREHNWESIPDICKGCNDWQTAGADYDEESIEGTRPFWYKNEDKTNSSEDHCLISPPSQ